MKISPSKYSIEDIKPIVDYVHVDSFHKAVWPVLSVSQCFALMPVNGIRDPDPKHLRFSWKSFRMLITIVFLLGSVTISFSYLKLLSNTGINAKNIVGFIFFSVGVATCVMFLLLAQKWPLLMQTWMSKETIFFFAPYKTPKLQLVFRVRLVSISILILAAVEHTLYLVSNIYTFKMSTLHCNTTYEFIWKDYFILHFAHIFVNVQYSFALSIFIFVINVAFTFIWNYMDLFIILVSFGIAIRFEQLNERILGLKGQIASEDTWADIRTHFVALCELLDTIDSSLSGIILLSCTNNLYFICFQLLNIFNKLRYPIEYIYFWYSLLYLIARTMCIFLCAARINDESKQPLNILRAVHSSSWCSEVERFIQHVTTQCVALSGMKFFYLTRKILFGMAGTIVTYELVLLQFDEQNQSKGPPSLC